MKTRWAFLCLVATLAWAIFPAQDASSKNLTAEEQLIEIGVGAFNDGFYDVAENHLSRFLKEYPKHEKTYDVCYLLGKTFLKKGRVKDAGSLFYKIINENKKFEFMDYTLFWAAEIEIDLGNWENGRRLLLTISKRFPKFEWIDYSYYLLGLLEFGSNRLTASETSFKKAAHLAGSNELGRSSYFWLGIIAYRKHDYEGAMDYFQKARGDSRLHPSGYLKYALLWLGEAQLKSGRVIEARQNYRAFYEQYGTDPSAPDIYWRLGFCAYRLGNLKEAIQIFQTFKNQFKNSRPFLYTHYILGEIYLNQGDYPSAMKELTFILNQSQENLLWGVSLLTLFWNHVQQGEMEEANKVFQRLQKLNHSEEEKILAQSVNAGILFAQGKISDAIPYFFNIINTRFREKALLQIGRGYFFENKFREAITNLDILLLEFPSSPYADEGLFIKGESLVQLGNLDLALESFDLIVRENRRDLWNLFALTRMASIHLFRNEDEKALSLFLRIVDDFQNHPIFYYGAFQLGNLYFKRKSVVEAVHHYSMILRANPLGLVGQTSFRLGEIFYLQGKYDKAFSSFKTALQHLKDGSPWFCLAQLEMGNLQRRRGEREEAKKSYKTILDHSKDEEIRKAARTMLNYVESL
jgi:TolA-binding protein